MPYPLSAIQAAVSKILGGGDTIAPTVAGFAATTPAIGTTVTITAFTASEAGALFLITTSAVPPLPGAAGWSATAQTTFDASSEGSCTLYPWVKDAAGNVSAVYGSPVAVEVYEVPAYANAGGTGDRTATITASTTLSVGGSPTVMVNGNTTETTHFFSAQTVAGKVIKFIFAAKKIITEMKWYSTSSDSCGSFQMQGSNNGTDWTNIGAAFDLDAPAGHMLTITTLSANATGYTQYRALGVSGSVPVGGVYNKEWEFKIGSLLP